MPLLAAQAPAVNRLYVEPFATKASAAKLRDEVIANLRKFPEVSLVNSESGADLILGGGGEIWVKGYRSLNPRSGTSTANGTPVYGGYLAVELRGAKGETLWSDLVTPAPESDDVEKDLSRSIAKHIAAVLARHPAAAPDVSLPRPKTVLKAAGATFPEPVYAKWFRNYRLEYPNLEIDYDPVGSEAGIKALLSGAVDFGASDSPEVIHSLSPQRESGFLLFPSVVGAVVPIFNLPGFTGELAFTPEALAGIYLGKIKKWNDPVLRQANRGVPLPDLDIVVVHRSDGSGTSYAWTDYLSQTIPDWKSRVGVGLAPQWPAGRAAPGNDGVAKVVKELGGSIGYVEYIYALQNHLAYGKVRNRNGDFVAASLESIAVAAQQAPKLPGDLKISIVNAPGVGAYPIASFTWLVVPIHIADEAKRNAITGLLKWILGPGQNQAAALGYLAIPKDIAARELTAIAKIH
jgi:phosphate transport system substrate-binding protein